MIITNQYFLGDFTPCLLFEGLEQGWLVNLSLKRRRTDRATEDRATEDDLPIIRGRIPCATGTIKR